MKNDQLITIFSDERVAVSGGGRTSTEIWRPWGHSRGFGCENAARMTYNGELRPVGYLQVLHGSLDGGELRRITDSIPYEIRVSCYHYMHWQIELIQLAEGDPEGFLQLHNEAPALVALLARSVAQHPLWGPWYFSEVLRSKHREIMRRCGFPAEWHTVFRKFSDISLCAHGYLELGITACRRPGMARLLRHVKRVNLDVLLLAVNHWETVRWCPSLLHIAAEGTSSHIQDHTGNAFSAETYQWVEQIHQLRNEMRKPLWPWRKVNDMSHLRRMVRQEVEHSLVTRGSAEVCYPAPPVSPCSEWHWISTSRELVEHAKRFSNCAGSHHWKCLCGECAIYESRYEIGDEAIIVVLLKEGRRWRVSDILGPANSLVDEELAANAREYFEEKIALEGGNT